MAYYQISQIYKYDKRSLAKVDQLLASEGLKRDKNLDYICAIYDDDQIIGTAGCFANTLRCFAVDSTYQGEGLLNQLLSHLIEVQAERGNSHLFLYTKPSAERFFKDLGFHRIVRMEGSLVFMENRTGGFRTYLKKLQAESDKSAENSAANVSIDAARIGAIVMNANPFTLGHQYLVETAAAACDLVHVFVLSEDVSTFPFKVRRKLVQEGCAHLNNVIVHESGPYMISNAVFPSYFLGDDEAVVKGHARLDIQIFSQVAEALGITDRYVGEEPLSRITAIYNQIMAEELPKAGVNCHVIPRKEVGGQVVSASRVRELLGTGAAVHRELLGTESVGHRELLGTRAAVHRELLGTELAGHTNEDKNLSLLLKELVPESTWIELQKW